MKTKVIYLITKSNWGGAQRYVHDLAVGLPKDRFDVSVALGGDGPLAHKLKDSGIRVIPIPSLQRDVSITKDIASLADIFSIVRLEKPDVLHINSSKAGLFGAIIGRLCGVPKIIFTAHGWAFNEDRPGWQKMVLKFMHWVTVLLSHQTIAVSNELKRQMDWPFTEKKLRIVYNGRDIKDLLGREEARNYLTEKEPRLEAFKNDLWSLTIAELHPVKRHDAVIEVMKELVDREPSMRHLIIGAGQEKAKLESRIKELGLTDHVFLLGSIDEASRYLKAADLFVLASRSEGMPYVLIESLIAGVPIVATKVGGIPEVVENNGSGLLIPPLDNKALVSAILLILQDPDLRASLREAALLRSSNFSFHKTLEKTVSLYR